MGRGGGVMVPFSFSFFFSFTIFVVFVIVIVIVLTAVVSPPLSLLPIVATLDPPLHNLAPNRTDPTLVSPPPSLPPEA